LKLKGRLYKSFVRRVMNYGTECCAMKKVDTRRMQGAEMRMMFGKTLRDGNPNGLLRHGTGVEEIENNLRVTTGQTKMALVP